MAQVDFEGPHPIEGAKEVSTVMTRHVSRALRLWLHNRRALAPEQLQRATAAWKQRLSSLSSKLPKQFHFAGGSDSHSKAVQPVELLHLRIDTTGRTLRVVTNE